MILKRDVTQPPLRVPNGDVPRDDLHIATAPQEADHNHHGAFALARHKLRRAVYL